MQLKEQAAAVIAPVITYFDRLFHDELKDQTAIFKACALIYALIDPVLGAWSLPAICWFCSLMQQARSASPLAFDSYRHSAKHRQGLLRRDRGRRR